jgi:CRISPR system Cascade subunit CasD
MPEFLTATLYAPMASFGGLAVGERRAAERYPPRSMLIGLLGAACGVDRADEGGQAALANGYHFAVQILSPGRPFTDYHTAQMPSRGKIRFKTRREELAAPALNTVLTSRDYRTDFLGRLAVCAAPGAPFTLGQVAAALRAPRYTLSFGRKSCPFGLPLAPAVAAFPNLRAAFAAAAAPDALLRPLRPQAGQIIADLALVEDSEDRTIEFPRDQPLSRRRWQFGLRQVAILNAAGQG